MATYVNDLRLKEIGTGESSGTWGSETNTNLELIGEALGFGTEAITTNADTHTTTVADGSTDPGRAMYLKYTGTLDSACTITIAPNTMSRMHFIENGTSGSQNIIISQGTGANVTIPAGDTKAVYLDGAGSGAAVVDAFASLNVVDLKVEDDLTVTDDLIVNGDIDLEGSIDVNGTANLDVVDIDGAVDMASTLQVDGAITSSAGATITVADNSDNLTLTSTDADANAGPNLRLYRNSGSPADNDGIGDIQYEGRNDNSQDVIYASLAGFIDDASDGTEDGILHINSMVAGTLVNRMSVIPAATVFNEGSVDVDFRVESDGEANMLFVDAGNNVVTVGGATFETADTFCVREAGANSVNTRLVNTNADANGVHLILQKDSSSPADNDELGQISFFGQDDAGNANTFAAIRVFADDVSNASEDGIITFSTIKAGTFTEHMRIQPDGSVGIGTTSPSGKLHVDSSATTEILFEGTKTSDGAIVDISFRNGSDSIAAIQALRVSNNDQADMAFFTQPNSGTVTERMRIESTGDVRFNIANAALTAAEVHTFNNAGRGNNLGLYTTGADQHFSIDMWNHTGGSCNQVQFRGGGSGAVTGTITSTGNNATQYNTSSDYRLKENVDYTWDATTRLKQLKPVRFNWIDDDTNTLEDGFLAHEVSSVVPNAVRGEKDDVYTEEEASDDMHINAGDIKRQQLDHSKLVPLLVKTIQELEARITTLEGE